MALFLVRILHAVIRPNLEMDPLLRFVLIAIVFSFSTDALKQRNKDPALLDALRLYRDAVNNPVYSNDWAVEVYGGEEVANDIAAAHGFINMGKVH